MFLSIKNCHPIFAIKMSTEFTITNNNRVFVKIPPRILDKTDLVQLALCSASRRSSCDFDEEPTSRWRCSHALRPFSASVSLPSQYSWKKKNKIQQSCLSKKDLRKGVVRRRKRRKSKGSLLQAFSLAKEEAPLWAAWTWFWHQEPTSPCPPRRYWSSSRRSPASASGPGPTWGPICPWGGRGFRRGGAAARPGGAPESPSEVEMRDGCLRSTFLLHL